MTPPPETVEAQLAVINTKLDLLIEQRSDHEVRLRVLEESTFSADDKRQLLDRLRSLEQFKWLLAGFCLAGGGIAGSLGAQFLH